MLASLYTLARLSRRYLVASRSDSCVGTDAGKMSNVDGEEFDKEFLKDQVQRLSSTLSRHQRKKLEEAPSNVDEDVHLQTSTHYTPWLSNKRLLTPLLMEYDSVIDELTKQLGAYKVELEAMTARVEQVTEENAYLHSELRRSLEGQIEAATQPGSSKFKLNRDDSLQQQMEIVINERDSFRNMLKKTSQELEIIQRSEQDKAQKLLECKSELMKAQQVAASVMEPVAELRTTCSKLSEERTRCLKAMKSQEVELSSLQDMLSRTTIELKAVNLKKEELKQSLDDKTFQLRKMEAEKKKTRSTENIIDERLHIMEVNIMDLEGKYQAAQREATNLKSEKSELENAFSTLQAQISTMEQREFEITGHVKDSIQVAEAAVLEKDQVVVREHQLAIEVESLQSTLDLLVQEAGERTRKEVNHARDEYNSSIDKMGLEIRHLEQECGECQAQLERCQREKKTLEKDLEKAYAHRPMEIRQTGDNIHDLQRRACLAERAREDALVKVEALEAHVKSLELCLSEEKEVNKQTLQDHRMWQRKVEDESQQLREQRLKAIARADTLQLRLRESEQAKDTVEMRLSKEVVSLEHRQAVKEKEMVYRLKSAEEAQHGSIQELRELLTAQYRLGAKWKVESKSLSENYERVTSDLKVELMRYKMRSNELTKQLKQIKSAKDELSKKHSETTKANTNLQHKLKEADDQVSELLAQEKNLLHTRRELNRQLDELKLQVSRIATRPPEMQSNPGSYSYLDGPQRYTGTSTTKPSPHHQRTLGRVLLDSTLPVQPLSFSAPPLPVQDGGEWNQALKDLKRSIQKVRKDLRQRGPENSYICEKKQEEEEEYVSDYSTISRGDLSLHSTTSAVS